MRIKNIAIENFRAIRRLELIDLSRTVVLAGQNGSGKSSVLDAIRLVKSAYGGYQPSEYAMWFGEYNIDIHSGTQDLLRILRDKRQSLRIAVEFEIEDTEKQYLLENVSDLAVENAWRQLTPYRAKFASGESLANRQRIHADTVAERSAGDIEGVRSALRTNSFLGELRLNPGDQLVVSPSLVLEYLFSNFKPDRLGVIDFHASSRHYAREQIGNVDLNVQQREQHFQAHALYNQQNKYQNFKAQLAGQYVRELLAEKAGLSKPTENDLTETLKDLFNEFFPGKTFCGPIPTPEGKLAFPVRTRDGNEHDIDDLSSGEKEVLYGYLRLRNATPRNSIVLIDEPELHLNPKLVRGLSNFYHKHLTLPTNCQLWLITHSDTLLRDSIGRPDFSVFYMRSADALKSGENQISNANDVHSSILPLIEDLAGFNPRAKVVLLEGGGETKFDATVIEALFPLFSQEVNLLSAGNKARVAALLSTLDEASDLADLDSRFYSISDRDSDPAPTTPPPRAYTWDVYHIENYLLEPCFVFQAISDLRLAKKAASETDVRNLLQNAAEKTVGSLVRHEVIRKARSLLVPAIEIRSNKTDPDVAADAFRAVSQIPERVGAVVAKQLSLASLHALATEFQDRFHIDLENGAWTKTFRGRDVLKQFVSLATLPIDYEIFKYAIITAMKHAKYQPHGMKAVLDGIHIISQPGS